MAPEDAFSAAARDDDIRVHRDKARQAVIARDLPCEKCGSSATPIVRSPERGSIDWWDDPSAYFACADCGAYLARLPPYLPDSLRGGHPPARE